jgi:hypothetical protein
MYQYVIICIHITYCTVYSDSRALHVVCPSPPPPRGAPLQRSSNTPFSQASYTLIKACSPPFPLMAPPFMTTPSPFRTVW